MASASRGAATIERSSRTEAELQILQGDPPPDEAEQGGLAFGWAAPFDRAQDGMGPRASLERQVAAGRARWGRAEVERAVVGQHEGRPGRGGGQGGEHV